MPDVPRRDDLHTVLIIGSGPIVIGQAAEFDYSGTQACRALRDEGYRVVLVNSNPATIMTDPEIADVTYVEPLTVDTVAEIIRKESPDALLPTLGGQTALNLAIELDEAGVLEEYGVELLGASIPSIHKAEDRQLFHDAMDRIGLKVPESRTVRRYEEAEELARKIGFPLIIRPSFTLGGKGGSVASSWQELRHSIEAGLDASPVGQVLVEKSVAGWKEFELEVMRDVQDNVVIVCSIENVDAMGVHTGDSITVAPAQTLSDRQYQTLRSASIEIIREIGVSTGGSNIQFAVDPNSDDFYVIEMNPRVSRSSALASKATGFPIAKIAAKLAVGYSLDEIPNDITEATPASFEPALDYVVTKIPRFAFEKFPGTHARLTTRMHSVGEVMAIGRTFTESLLKAIASLEVDGADIEPRLDEPSPYRILAVFDALRAGMDIPEIYARTHIDPFFIASIARIVAAEGSVGRSPNLEDIRELKKLGLTDEALATAAGLQTEVVRGVRQALGVAPTYKSVDTCAGEFPARTPYFYSTYEVEDEVERGENPSVVVLGSGPNRIGQGIEFDYACVHASYALREAGMDAVMVNSNPETVSTDYDTSTRLYFEPLSAEHVLEVVRRERPEGVILQFGGQSPLKLARELEKAGVPILGTSPDAIDLAEDRSRFGRLLTDLGIPHPPFGTATTADEARQVARELSYPVVVRPSYVLGGRRMEIVYSDEDLDLYLRSSVPTSPEHPILVDKFMEAYVEVDVDAVCDGEDVYIGGVMEHIEEAGVHSGDSSCVTPPITLQRSLIKTIESYTRKLALAVGVVGLVNIQFVVRGEDVMVIECNPRASRTVPFISKATGVPLAKVATRVSLGEKLRDMGLEATQSGRFSVKAPVFPFDRFADADPLLGPEMRSTGEAMGIDRSFGGAFAKALTSAGQKLPESGRVYISVANRDKRAVVLIARAFADLGFEVLASEGTAEVLRNNGLPVSVVPKIGEDEGGRDNVLARIEAGGVDLVVNTPWGRGARTDGYLIRRAALTHGVPCITTLAGASAALQGIEATIRGETRGVNSLQNLYAAKA
ncbi:carbamoyl-phosphate synthase, large subunit [Rubrobacter radiotolerans]|uniref:Carbamoyl phosphate synthase large chain n=1 Tax=Rubrobacter radiotolerans TaxID=42256 RepID=A0A023X2S9_RUBRA|nr:carbamoyl-phosphate synthase large subunit [Rubrobacter radiotolerans]AHY46767.1 carbamoyl-phosphate synthase, large subunit [Rubrobacter radiotolerans]MDX5894174.1 carbamoyl-phosphate synthase large subunit [Rubrobacter radiotolerans]